MAASTKKDPKIAQLERELEQVTDLLADRRSIIDSQAKEIQQLRQDRDEAREDRSRARRALADAESRVYRLEGYRERVREEAREARIRETMPQPRELHEARDTVARYKFASEFGERSDPDDWQYR